MRRRKLIAGLLASTMPVVAQDAAASAAAPVFEVVPVKLHDEKQQRSRMMMSDNSYVANNSPVTYMMLIAYG